MIHKGPKMQRNPARCNNRGALKASVAREKASRQSLHIKFKNSNEK
jgi:hypothetical protein